MRRWISGTSKAILTAKKPPFQLPRVQSTDHLHPSDVALSSFFAMHRPLQMLKEQRPQQPQETGEEHETGGSKQGRGRISVFTDSASGMESDPHVKALPSRVLAQLGAHAPPHPPSSTTSTTTSSSIMSNGPFASLQEQEEAFESISPHISVIVLGGGIERSGASMLLTSVKRKRKLKMNKHKYEKRRKAQRALRRRIAS